MIHWGGSCSFGNGEGSAPSLKHEEECLVFVLKKTPGYLMQPPTPLPPLPSMVDMLWFFLFTRETAIAIEKGGAGQKAR